ncbi:MULTISPECIES: toll/interleukin-1 receptor domain-containing protein [unclassified Clostridium]|uniref:toll/interleukin-1 receptor domain-containing protein n=1 Tax=unclassified Clostridium TaxID=2614128 RepID=UPI0020793933|nr:MULTISPECIES: toll/interleukin-1 receptor domain-containing protein [unclassified Clostridium]
MSMTIFISHKNEDSNIASIICNKLNDLGVCAYLDLLEGDLTFDGEKLTNHIKGRLNSCTDLLVVMSKETQKSWWVPFEIGMASQLDFPIVSYLTDKVSLPEYLSYWPALKELADLPKYISAKNSILNENTTYKKSYNSEKYTSKHSQTDAFYKKLKNIL